MFHWSEVGDSLLDALSSESDKDFISSTAEIAKNLENGPAKRGLLKHAVEKALSMDDEELSRTNAIKTLWKLVLYDTDENLLTRLSNKFNRMNPRFLAWTAFSNIWQDPNILTLNKAVMVSITASRIEWLEKQIDMLEQPFTWKMPVAEFPENAQVEAFLRGPDSQLTMPGVLPSEKVSRSINASFSTKSGGAGSGAFFTILKTRKWYDDNKNQVPQLKKEMRKLKTATAEVLVAVISESRKK